MSKLVVLKLGEGDFEERGFPVTLRITDNETSSEIEITGRLPPAPQVLESYEYWCECWQQFYGNDPEHQIRTLSKKGTSGEITSGNRATSCKQAGRNLTESLNNWLTSDYFSSIREKFLQKIKTDENIRIILQTDNLLLRDLPWSEWKLLADYKNTEIVFSPINYENPPKQKYKNRKNKIKILLIFGDERVDNGQDVNNQKFINTAKDRQIFKQRLPDADIEELVKPERDKLCKKLKEKSWDIIFFAGHAKTQDNVNQSCIKINDTEDLSIDDLKNTLRGAIDRGLSLAIFNSCDGLGLAADLADLKIPQTIVMRKQIRDDVAHEFLEQFLGAFARNHSVHLAVRKAREHLHDNLQNKYPCVSWLPVIFENPAYQPLTWVPRKYVPKLPTVIVASLVVPFLVSGVRYSGVLQPVELMAYDRMMQWRPDEKPALPPRILVVEVTQRDILDRDAKERGSSSLSDTRLAQLLEEINKHKPQAIGLDIYRDLSAGAKPNPDLEKLFQQNKNLFAVCKVNEPQGDVVGEVPASFIPKENLGFSDVLLDPDGVLRRHLLYIKTNSSSPCTAENALSWQLAIHYLHPKGIEPENTPEGDGLLGNARLKALSRNAAGGYQIFSNNSSDNQRSSDYQNYHILLNYHTRGKIADFVNVNSILDRNRKSNIPSLVKDRIILIGVTDPKFERPDGTPDEISTPYGVKMRGVYIHAQMVNQLIRAALGERQLLKVWPWEGDFFWICGWSCVGGLIVLVWRRWDVIPIGVTLIVAVAISSGWCFLLFCQGTWIPLIPSLLTLLFVNSGSILITIFYPNFADNIIDNWQKLNKRILSKNQ